MANELSEVRIVNGSLTCPRCGTSNLHHVNVTSYDRGEDGAVTIETKIKAGAATMRAVPSSSSANPSARRDGIAVQFWCENCGDSEDRLLELTIAQHKGETDIGWKFEA